MENMKSKKFSFAHICAYLSLAISVTMIVLWCCNAGGFKVVSLDSFVGVIVALLAIVVTLVVGWQIYNALELKAKIEELNNLKEILDIQEKKSKEQSKKVNHLIAISFAENEINGEDYLWATIYFIKALKYTMLSSDAPINIEVILRRMEFAISKIQNGTKYDNLEDIRKINKEIQASKFYNMIKTQYEKIYNDFISKVKDDKNE